jgi:dihydroorotate dehydrogenase electron transfer subunit
LKQVLATVTSSNPIMPGVCLIWLQAPGITSLAKPGQFVMVKCGEDNLLRRPFSIHQVDNERNSLALLFKVVGRGTDWLSKRQSGASIDILGPLGNGFNIFPASRNLLLVGGGIGVAPLPFLAREARKLGLLTSMCLGTATANEPLRNLIPSDIKCAVATEDGTAGHCGFITELLPEYIDRADQVFVCGPSPMYQAMAEMPQLKGKPVEVSLEARMGCGFGVCYGCTVKTKQGLKQVCRDGPVFELDDILWGEFVDI